MKAPPRRLFRSKDRESRYREPSTARSLAMVREGLRELEERGYVIIIPAERTRRGERARDDERVIIPLRSTDGRRWTVPWYDPRWVAQQEHELGIKDRWLFRHIKESIARGWLPPVREGGVS